MSDPRGEFKKVFERATGKHPYDYQIRLATDDDLPALVQIPTGLGKTAAVVLAWLWRRRFAEPVVRQATPRRLVYCLPMRVLVEQTEQAVKKWLGNLGLATELGVHLLMGGEEATDWDVFPEKDAVLIGTQDMLLSRALNRGYAMSRYRWPVQFGLLNNDCLWVFDEIQLMGSGLATTAQLEAFRKQVWSSGKDCASVWMSATLDRRWLRTVDFDPASLRTLTLEEEDLQLDEVRCRFRAKKPIKKASHAMGDAKGLAEEIKQAHRPGTRTLVVVNTVQRARELHSALDKLFKKAGRPPEIVLIHSRFRPPDRQDAVRRLLEPPGSEGSVVVSTQVIEAGVDISAVTLFTELAPWASLVQRFGRCNRAGTDTDAQVYWIDLPRGKRAKEAAAKPYDVNDLDIALRHLRKCCAGVGPADLPEVELTYKHGQVLRSKDLVELFDTTPDLSGYDIDIDRYVRGIESSDVQVFWREWDLTSPPAQDIPAPQRHELCPVPVAEFRDYLRAKVNRKPRARTAYRWDYLERTWAAADAARVYPGQVFLLHVSAGGYSAVAGWDAKWAEAVVPLLAVENGRSAEANEDDGGSEVDRWQSIAEHTDEVCQELGRIVGALGIEHGDPLHLAARWHDRGKAHPAFVAKLDGKALQSSEAQRILSGTGGQIAKAPKGCWRESLGPNAHWDPNDGRRRHFRHELASALAVLLAPQETVPPEIRDLVAYLVAAHHGKVRLSIRSLPNEFRPPDAFRRFARGLWEGDVLPATDLGGVIAPEVRLSLEPMELGQCESPPFANQPSWAERMLRLRNQLGPFRLAFLEAVLRAADIRASRTRDHDTPST